MNDFILNGVNSYLGITDDEADVIEGRLNGAVSIALGTGIKLLGFTPNVTDEAINRLSNYVNSRVFIELYGDTLTTGILNYHLSRVSELEEQLRYTSKGV